MVHKLCIFMETEKSMPLFTMLAASVNQNVINVCIDSSIASCVCMCVHGSCLFGDTVHEQCDGLHVYILFVQ